MNLSLGWPITEEHLREEVNYAGVLEVEDDFLDARFQRECERLNSKTEKIGPEECVIVFLFLRPISAYRHLCKLHNWHTELFT